MEIGEEGGRRISRYITVSLTYKGIGNDMLITIPLQSIECDEIIYISL